MQKDDLIVWVNELFDLKAKISRERKNLLVEFEKEFPPLIGARGGYLLIGLMCSKKSSGCPDCPHSLAWRWYRRPGKKVLFGKRSTRLPPSFWRSPRSEEVKERFRYYDGKMQELNATWKELQRKILSMHATARSVVGKLKNRDLLLK